MIKVATTLSVSLIAAGLVLFSAPDAQARDYRAQMNSVQMQTIANLNTQRSSIETRINTAVASNQLSAVQANALKAQLAQTGVQQSQMLQDGVLDVSETQSLINSMNSIDGNLQSSINSYVGQFPMPGSSTNIPVNGYPSNPWHRNNFAARQEINNLFSSISNSLENGRSSGRLNRSEYRSLKEDLDKLSLRKDKMYISGGRLNYGESTSLRNSLFSLQSRVDREMNDNDMAWSHHKHWQ
ncbi:MAG: hypothetical protein K2X27_16435 [Candidatus Obscuribacterales bacterium]|nr:hypothetical protein [Candidatus Obscuribacterales bacterium]